MSKTVDINVHHVTRIEGHGNIRVRATDGVIEKIEWRVPEAPRFFEAMVVGRQWDEIQPIVSRICGICSVTHSLAAVKAVEDAMGVEVSEQTDKIRILSHYGEYMESHILHVGYLVAPDLLGVKSVVPLTETHLEVVKKIIHLHRLGNQWMELLAGRKTHPVAYRVGGFGKLPGEAELRDLKTRIQDAIPDLKAVAELVLSLAGALPAFERETEYIALAHPGIYTFYHGHIASTDTDIPVPVQEFERVANEYVSPRSTAKWTRWHRRSYAVGALSRFKLNGHLLKPLATEVAGMFGLTKTCCNPFMNTVAQVVECVQVVEHALELIDELLSTGIRAETPKVTPKAGCGAGSVEAPRGILFHRYEFDRHGVCRTANICIPTGQNHANIQHDFEALVPRFLDRGEDELRRIMEMLVRSYDPCVSCSTHFLDVEFV